VSSWTAEIRSLSSDPAFGVSSLDLSSTVILLER